MRSFSSAVGASREPAADSLRRPPAFTLLCALQDAPTAVGREPFVAVRICDVDVRVAPRLALSSERVLINVHPSDEPTASCASLPASSALSSLPSVSESLSSSSGRSPPLPSPSFSSSSASCQSPSSDRERPSSLSGRPPLRRSFPRPRDNLPPSRLPRPLPRVDVAVCSLLLRCVLPPCSRVRRRRHVCPGTSGIRLTPRPSDLPSDQLPGPLTAVSTVSGRNVGSSRRRRNAALEPAAGCAQAPPERDASCDLRRYAPAAVPPLLRCGTVRVSVYLKSARSVKKKHTRDSLPLQSERAFSCLAANSIRSRSTCLLPSVCRSRASVASPVACTSFRSPSLERDTPSRHSSPDSASRWWTRRGTSSRPRLLLSPASPFVRQTRPALSLTRRMSGLEDVSSSSVFLSSAPPFAVPVPLVGSTESFLDPPEDAPSSSSSCDFSSSPFPSWRSFSPSARCGSARRSGTSSIAPPADWLVTSATSDSSKAVLRVANPSSSVPCSSLRLSPRCPTQPQRPEETRTSPPQQQRVCVWVVGCEVFFPPTPALAKRGTMEESLVAQLALSLADPILDILQTVHAAWLFNSRFSQAQHARVALEHSGGSSSTAGSSPSLLRTSSGFGTSRGQPFPILFHPSGLSQSSSSLSRSASSSISACPEIPEVDSSDTLLVSHGAASSPRHVLQASERCTQQPLADPENCHAFTDPLAFLSSSLPPPHTAVEVTIKGLEVAILAPSPLAKASLLASPLPVESIGPPAIGRGRGGDQALVTGADLFVVLSRPRLPASIKSTVACLGVAGCASEALAVSEATCWSTSPPYGSSFSLASPPQQRLWLDIYPPIVLLSLGSASLALQDAQVPACKALLCRAGASSFPFSSASTGFRGLRKSSFTAGQDTSQHGRRCVADKSSSLGSCERLHAGRSQPLRTSRQTSESTRAPVPSADREAGEVGAAFNSREGRPRRYKGDLSRTRDKPALPTVRLRARFSSAFRGFSDDSAIRPKSTTPRDKERSSASRFSARSTDLRRSSSASAEVVVVTLSETEDERVAVGLAHHSVQKKLSERRASSQKESRGQVTPMNSTTSKQKISDPYASPVRGRGCRQPSSRSPIAEAANDKVPPSQELSQTEANEPQSARVQRTIELAGEGVTEEQGSLCWKKERDADDARVANQHGYTTTWKAPSLCCQIRLQDLTCILCSPSGDTLPAFKVLPAVSILSNTGPGPPSAGKLCWDLSDRERGQPAPGFVREEMQPVSGFLRVGEHMKGAQGTEGARRLDCNAAGQEAGATALFSSNCPEGGSTRDGQESFWLSPRYHHASFHPAWVFAVPLLNCAATQQTAILRPRRPERVLRSVRKDLDTSGCRPDIDERVDSRRRCLRASSCCGRGNRVVLSPSSGDPRRPSLACLDGPFSASLFCPERDMSPPDHAEVERQTLAVRLFCDDSIRTWCCFSLLETAAATAAALRLVRSQWNRSAAEQVNSLIERVQFEVSRYRRRERASRRDARIRAAAAATVAAVFLPGCARSLGPRPGSQPQDAAAFPDARSPGKFAVAGTSPTGNLSVFASRCKPEPQDAMLGEATMGAVARRTHQCLGVNCRRCQGQTDFQSISSFFPSTVCLCQVGLGDPVSPTLCSAESPSFCPLFCPLSSSTLFCVAKAGALLRERRAEEARASSVQIAKDHAAGRRKARAILLDFRFPGGVESILELQGIPLLRVGIPEAGVSLRAGLEMPARPHPFGAAGTSQRNSCRCVLPGAGEERRGSGKRVANYRGRQLGECTDNLAGKSGTDPCLYVMEAQGVPAGRGEGKDGRTESPVRPSTEGCRQRACSLRGSEGEEGRQMYDWCLLPQDGSLEFRASLGHGLFCSTMTTLVAGGVRQMTGTEADSGLRGLKRPRTARSKAEKKEREHPQAKSSSSPGSSFTGCEPRFANSEGFRSEVGETEESKVPRPISPSAPCATAENLQGNRCPLPGLPSSASPPVPDCAPSLLHIAQCELALAARLLDCRSRTLAIARGASQHRSTSHSLQGRKGAGSSALSVRCQACMQTDPPVLRRHGEAGASGVEGTASHTLHVSLQAQVRGTTEEQLHTGTDGPPCDGALNRAGACRRLQSECGACGKQEDSAKGVLMRKAEKEPYPRRATAAVDPPLTANLLPDHIALMVQIIGSGAAQKKLGVRVKNLLATEGEEKAAAGERERGSPVNSESGGRSTAGFPASSSASLGLLLRTLRRRVATRVLVHLAASDLHGKFDLARGCVAVAEYRDVFCFGPSLREGASTVQFFSSTKTALAKPTDAALQTPGSRRKRWHAESKKARQDPFSRISRSRETERSRVKGDWSGSDSAHQGQAEEGVDSRLARGAFVSSSTMEQTPNKGKAFLQGQSADSRSLAELDKGVLFSETDARRISVSKKDAAAARRTRSLVRVRRASRGEKASKTLFSSEKIRRAFPCPEEVKRREERAEAYRSRLRGRDERIVVLELEGGRRSRRAQMRGLGCPGQRRSANGDPRRPWFEGLDTWQDDPGECDSLWGRGEAVESAGATTTAKAEPSSSRDGERKCEVTMEEEDEGKRGFCGICGEGSESEGRREDAEQDNERMERSFRDLSEGEMLDQEKGANNEKASRVRGWPFPRNEAEKGKKQDDTVSQSSLSSLCLPGARRSSRQQADMSALCQGWRKTGGTRKAAGSPCPSEPVRRCLLILHHLFLGFECPPAFPPPYPARSASSASSVRARKFSSRRVSHSAVSRSSLKQSSPALPSSVRCSPSLDRSETIGPRNPLQREACPGTAASSVPPQDCSRCEGVSCSHSFGWSAAADPSGGRAAQGPGSTPPGKAALGQEICRRDTGGISSVSSLFSARCWRSPLEGCGGHSLAGLAAVGATPGTDAGNLLDSGGDLGDVPAIPPEPAPACCSEEAQRSCFQRTGGAIKEVSHVSPADTVNVGVLGSISPAVLFRLCGVRLPPPVPEPDPRVLPVLRVPGVCVELIQEYSDDSPTADKPAVEEGDGNSTRLPKSEGAIRRQLRGVVDERRTLPLGTKHAQQNAAPSRAGSSCTSASSLPVQSPRLQLFCVVSAPSVLVSPSTLVCVRHALALGDSCRALLLPVVLSLGGFDAECAQPGSVKSAKNEAAVPTRPAGQSCDGREGKPANSSSSSLRLPFFASARPFPLFVLDVTLVCVEPQANLHYVASSADGCVPESPSVPPLASYSSPSTMYPPGSAVSFSKTEATSLVFAGGDLLTVRREPTCDSPSFFSFRQKWPAYSRVLCDDDVLALSPGLIYRSSAARAVHQAVVPTVSAAVSSCKQGSQLGAQGPDETSETGASRQGEGKLWRYGTGAGPSSVSPGCSAFSPAAPMVRTRASDDGRGTERLAMDATSPYKVRPCSHVPNSVTDDLSRWVSNDSSSQSPSSLSEGGSVPTAAPDCSVSTALPSTMHLAGWEVARVTKVTDRPLFSAEAFPVVPLWLPGQVHREAPHADVRPLLQKYSQIREGARLSYRMLSCDRAVVGGVFPKGTELDYLCATGREKENQERNRLGTRNSAHTGQAFFGRRSSSTEGSDTSGDWFSDPQHGGAREGEGVGGEQRLRWPSVEQEGTREVGQSISLWEKSLGDVRCHALRKRVERGGSETRLLRCESVGAGPRSLMRGERSLLLSPYLPRELRNEKKDEALPGDKLSWGLLYAPLVPEPSSFFMPLRVRESESPESFGEESKHNALMSTLRYGRACLAPTPLPCTAESLPSLVCLPLPTDSLMFAAPVEAPLPRTTGSGFFQGHGSQVTEKGRSVSLPGHSHEELEELRALLAGRAAAQLVLSTTQVVAKCRMQVRLDQKSRPQFCPAPLPRLCPASAPHVWIQLVFYLLRAPCSVFCR